MRPNNRDGLLFCLVPFSKNISTLKVRITDSAYLEILLDNKKIIQFK